MKIAVFVSDLRLNVDTLDRLTAEKIGIILVSNGVYHASVKEGGKASALLSKSADFYALSDDLETRGIDSTKIDSKVKVISYGDIVDLIMNDYDKPVWL
ncbi:sulfurtransferase complex subunit TusB [bacterium]|nr:sulfurtransferase complex subunit TusB [bacterium]